MSISAVKNAQELVDLHVVREHQPNGDVENAPRAQSRRCSLTTGLLIDLARASFMFEARLSSLAGSNRSV